MVLAALWDKRPRPNPRACTSSFSLRINLLGGCVAASRRDASRRDPSNAMQWVCAGAVRWCGPAACRACGEHRRAVPSCFVHEQRWVPLKQTQVDWIFVKTICRKGECTSFLIIFGDMYKEIFTLNTEGITSVFRNRRGNFAITFALVTTVIFAAGGLAVDYAMLLNTKSRLNNALDAASLATSRAISIGEIRTTGNDARNYFKKVFASNMGDDAFDPARYTLDRFVVDTDRQTVSAEVSIDRPLMLMRVASGETSEKVASRSVATYGGNEIEVAMVFDFSSSMRGAPIAALREAAKDSVRELLSVNTPSKTNARISLVPYSRAVNVGPFLARYVYPDYNEAKSDAPRFSRSLFNSTGLGYSVAALKTQFGRCRTRRGSVRCNWRRRHVINGDGTSVDTCSTERKAPKSGGRSHQFTDKDPTFGMISRDSRLDDGKCIPARLVPLSSNENSLINTITNYRTHTGTAGQIGLQWAWYTLSHNWANYLPSGSAPGDMATNPELRKYIIFMTDGEFNRAYADNRDLDEWDEGIAKATTLSLCNAIKQKGIKIFSIGFDLHQSSAIDMMKRCASPDDGALTYFYTPSTTRELKSVYASIAKSIQTLRLLY